MLLSAALPVSAQVWGESPRQGVCFFEDRNYRGQSFCVESGDERATMPSGADNGISSIRVYGSVEVQVYEDARFRGDSMRFRQNISSLADEGFDDVISSVRVRSRSSGNSGPPRPSYGSPNPDVIIRRAYQDVLERDPDPAGLRQYRSHMIDDGWTEQQVRQALRDSPEFREKNAMSREKAEAIVRRAYLSVLKREPDAGSSAYVDNVYRKKWTQADVERALRNSPEYRNR